MTHYKIELTAKTVIEIEAESPQEALESIKDCIEMDWGRGEPFEEKEYQFRVLQEKG